LNIDEDDMFGLFGNKKESIDEDTVLIAGVTAGIGFRLQESKFGSTAISDTNRLITNYVKTACEMLSINPDEKSRGVIHAVAITVAMDTTGVGAKIADRYVRGETKILPNEAQKIWDLTIKNAQDFSSEYGKS